MQRLCSKVLSSNGRLLHRLSQRTVAFPVIRSISTPVPTGRHPLALGFGSLSLPLPTGFRVMQACHFATKDRSRAPTTPVVSKLKKYKMKSYSSFKSRFRTMKDGQIRRWRAGKRHNAHQKSKNAKRRLRKPAIVHLAYAKVLKKLNFCG